MCTQPSESWETKVPSSENGAAGEIGATLTTFEVAESFGLGGAGESLVRSSDGFSPGEVAEFEVGQEHLVFGVPFEFTPGEPTGDYIAVGQLAAYRINRARESAERITTGDGLLARAEVAS